MRRPITMLLAFSLLATTTLDAAAGPESAAQQAPPTPRVIASVDPGQTAAEIRASAVGRYRGLAAGSPIGPRSEVRAGLEPLRLTMHNGARVELAPGSSAIFSGVIDIGFGRGGKTAATRIELRSGEVSVQMPVADRRRMVLLAGGDTLAAVGSGSTVRARGGPAGLTVGVYVGQARIATTGAWKDLAAGKVVVLRSGVTTPEATTLATGPSWVADEQLANAASSWTASGALGIVSGADEKARISARWTPVTGASGYIVEVARDEAFTRVIDRREVDAHDTTHTSEPLGPGRYFARAFTRGAAGLPGSAGPVRPMRVARIILPPGARAEAGEVLLPIARGARWDDPRGLEMALGRVGFSAAPAEFGLTSDAPRDAQVRLAGERAAIPIKIAPQSLYAEVDLWPKRATWPVDPVEISVRVEDRRGGCDCPAPRVKVRVNMEEVAVSFRREGNVYRGRIEPRTTEGPWVVRVEAADAHGNPIGRGFLEVVHAAPTPELASR